jgi:Ni,Fe-hydrogenase III component G
MHPYVIFDAIFQYAKECESGSGTSITSVVAKNKATDAMFQIWKDAKRFQWIDNNCREGEGTDAYPFCVRYVTPSRFGVNMRKAIDEEIAESECAKDTK